MKVKTRRIIIILSLVLSISLLGNISLLLKSDKPKQRNLVAMYLENEDGKYALSSQNKFPTEGYVLNMEKSSCKNGGTLSQDPKTKKLSLSVTNKDECTVYFDKEKIPTSQEILVHLNQTSQGIRTDFDSVATTDEGIFEMEDDYGTSYYYRGAVENNYVKYGVNSSGQEMWWRIIRINGDGSVRMVFDGTQGYANGTANDARFAKVEQLYNENRNDAKYVGWMYGPEGTVSSTSKEQAQSNIADSNAKKVVDAWYKENLEDTGYEVNISDEIFCNDRSTPGKDITGVSSDTGLGYGTKHTYFGAYAREKAKFDNTGVEPSFTCPQKNDAFTVSDTTKGNGALTYPVGLITADEIVAAGGKYGKTNKKYYLYKSAIYHQWSLSPYWFGGSTIIATVNGYGDLSAMDTDRSLAVAPVINLTPEYANSMAGTGTITDPFRAAK